MSAFGDLLQKTGVAKILSHIVSTDKYKFAYEALKMAPNYFWIVPASSTGTHHPQISQGEGGLVRHTLAATQIAIDLFRAYPELDKSDQDDVIVALLLHDTLKKGFPEGEKTASGHEILPEQYYKELSDLVGIPEYKVIMDLISTHMGIWNQSEIPPAVKDGYRISPAEIVHLADYLSSRKLFENIFKEDKI